MKKLSSGDFLDEVAHSMPAEFSELIRLAYRLVSLKAGIGIGCQISPHCVFDARAALEIYYAELVRKTKIAGFAPNQAVGLFQIINHVRS
ncbi:MAG: hypothetical protein WC027_00590 [Candidatus Paceibacterota bacterium]